MGDTQTTALEVPPHVNGDPRYVTKEIHFRTVHGALLWTELAIFRRCLAVGDVLCHGGVWLRVRRIAVADSVEHVNVEPQ